MRFWIDVGTSQAIPGNCATSLDVALLFCYSAAMMNKMGAILVWAALACLSLLIVLGIHQLWIITCWPFQLEFREGAMATSAYALRLGLNPFSLKFQPQFANVYGPLYPLITALVGFSPTSSFVTARVVSGFFIVCNSIVLGWWISRVSTLPLAIGAGALFFYQQLDASSGAFPMALGTLLLITPLALLDVRGVTAARARYGAIFGALAFLTKPYFAIASGVVGIVTILRLSWREVLLYFMLLAVIFSTIIIAYARLFPALWVNAILHHVAVVRFDPSYRAVQMQAFMKETWPLLASFILLILYSACKRYRARSLRWREICGDPAVVAASCTWALFYFKMSGHSGSAVGHYIYHIFMPFFLVLWCKTLSNIYSERSSISGNLWTGIGTALLTSTILLTPAWQRSLRLTPEEQSAWEFVRENVRHSNQVVADPPLVSLLIEKSLPIFDSGQSEFFPSGGTPPKLLAWIAPDFRNKINNRVRGLAKRIKHGIQNGLFDTLIFSQGYPHFFETTIASERYERCQAVDLAMPLSSQRWTVDLFRRKGECLTQ